MFLEKSLHFACSINFIPSHSSLESDKKTSCFRFIGFQAFGFVRRFFSREPAMIAAELSSLKRE